jgi:hypothetical protein
VQAQADVEARAIPGLVEKSEDLADKLEILSQNFHELRRYAQEGINAITRKIRVIETLSPRGNGHSTASPTFDRLVERLDNLESQARVYARNVLCSSDGEDFQIELDALKRRVSNTENETHEAHSEKQIGTLERRVARLEDNGGPTSHDKQGEAGGESSKVLELEQ